MATLVEEEAPCCEVVYLRRGSLEIPFEWNWDDLLMLV